MRRIASLAVLVAVATLAAGCSTSSSGSGGLTGKTWTLSAVTQDVPAFQGVIPPAEQGKYTIEFRDDNTFSAKADCNTVQGAYYAGSGGSMTISPGPTTLVACPPGSLGSAYTAALATTRAYDISNGTLSLILSRGGKLQFT
jgi:heat shock protein HslJ